MKDFLKEARLAAVFRSSPMRLPFETASAMFSPSHANVNGPVSVLPSASSSGAVRWYADIGKRGFDVLVTLLFAPFWGTIILMCAFALWIEGGQPFYTQDRLGRGGGRFRIFKLRTMVRNADQILEDYLAKDPAMRAEWDLTQKLKKDPRITRVGAFLRATSLDELPQLINVLRGEMSLVGPRPMMPDQLPLYPEPAPYFALRPGITGLWQVSARNEQGFAFRSEVDAEYYHHLSAHGDFRLLFLTIGVVLRRTGY